MLRQPITLKVSWQVRCSMLVEMQERDNLSCRELAAQTGYSLGMMAQSLTLGYALRVYPKQLGDIKHFTQALKFVKEKNFKRKLD